MYFRYFVIISPWKRVWPFILTNLNPLHPCFVLNLVKISPMVLKKKIKCEKIDRQVTKNSWSERFTWTLSSGELKIDKQDKNTCTHIAAPLIKAIVELHMMYGKFSQQKNVVFITRVFLTLVAGLLNLSFHSLTKQRYHRITLNKT